MFKFIFKSSLLLFLTFTLISCNKEDSSPLESNNNFQALLSYTPQYGIAGSEFSFEFRALEGEEQTATEGYQFRFDLNND